MSDFFSSILDRCHLLAATVLAASLLVPSLAMSLPADHETLMKDGSYKEAYGIYEATRNEARDRLDAKDFEALQKSIDEEMEAWVKEDTTSGTSASEAWQTAYMGAAGTLGKELEHDWLRRNAEGVQGFYRLQSEGGVTAFLCVLGGDEPGQYAVKMEVSQTAAPYASGELDGLGILEGQTMKVVDKNEPEAPLSITFDGDKATVAESQAFKASGLLGNGVSLDGKYLRERK